MKEVKMSQLVGECTELLVNEFEGEESNERYLLARCHSVIVALTISKICREIEDISNKEVRSCIVAGMLHDLGKGKHAVDGEEHGKTSCDIIEKNGILDRLDNIDKKGILEAISIHSNKPKNKKFEDNVPRMARILICADIISKFDINIMGTYDNEKLAKVYAKNEDYLLLMETEAEYTAYTMGKLILKTVLDRLEQALKEASK